MNQTTGRVTWTDRCTVPTGTVTGTTPGPSLSYPTTGGLCRGECLESPRTPTSRTVVVPCTLFWEPPTGRGGIRHEGSTGEKSGGQGRFGTPGVFGDDSRLDPRVPDGPVSDTGPRSLDGTEDPSVGRGRGRTGPRGEGRSIETTSIVLGRTNSGGYSSE